MIHWSSLFAALLATQSAAQEAPVPEWEGVWRGTIGTLPVSVCLGRPNGYNTNAAYYYHSTMRTIRLEPKSDGGWIEHGEGGTAVTGMWQIVGGNADRIQGEWEGSGRKLPIALERVPVEADEEVWLCGSREFLAARIRRANLVRKPMRFGTFAYTSVTWDVGPGFADVALESFEFAPTRPGDRAIIEAVRLDPDNPGGRGEYLTCVRAPLERWQSDGEFYLSYEPIHASRDLIGTKVNSSGSCGGAHPYHGYDYQTWDRVSGQEVELYRWFRPQAFERVRYASDSEDYFKATPAFARFLSSHMGIEDSECRSVVEAAEFWGVGLTRNGMIFTPSLAHVLTPCVDDARIPYAQLTRWLNREGRAGVARARRAP